MVVHPSLQRKLIRKSVRSGIFGLYCLIYNVFIKK